MKAMVKKFVFGLLITAGALYPQQRFVFERVITPLPTQRAIRFVAITVSQFGDIYLSDIRQHEIYRFDSDGQLLNVNGGYGWNEGQFDLPLDLYMSSGLNLLVADYNNHRVARYDRELNYLTTYPDPGGAYRISFPRSVVLTNQGELYILSDENLEISRVQLNRKNVTVFAGVGYGEYSLRDPLLIRMDDQGVIHVLEESSRIVQFDRFGTPLGQLKIPADAPATSLIPVGKDLVVTLRGAPYVLVYSAMQKSWQPLTVELPQNIYFVAVSYQNERLCLLSSDNRIFVYHQP